MHKQRPEQKQGVYTSKVGLDQQIELHKAICWLWATRIVLIEEEALTGSTPDGAAVIELDVTSHSRHAHLRRPIFGPEMPILYMTCLMDQMYIYSTIISRIEMNL